MPSRALVSLHVTGLTTTCCKIPVLPRKLPSPAYWAAMALVPSGSELLVVEATPLSRALVLKGRPLAVNTTSPVGLSAAGGAPFKVAVKVTFEAVKDGLSDETRL